jgi:HK97 gp10 family phage protein
MTPKQFAKWLESLQPEVADKMSRIMIEGGNRIQKEAMNTVAKNSHNTGNLLNHIDSTTNITGKIATEIIIGTTVPYAPYVEYGSGPHKSSNNSSQFRDDLKRWCELHGLPFWPVYKKIVKNGIKEKPFLIPAFNKIAPKVQKALEKVLKEIK